jgi:hypothetical protein
MPHSDYLASTVKYENEANAAGKLDTRSASRKRAFDHHDTLKTWMPSAVVIGLFYTYFTPIQVVTRLCETRRGFFVQCKVESNNGSEARLYVYTGWTFCMLWSIQALCIHRAALHRSRFLIKLIVRFGIKCCSICMIRRDLLWCFGLYSCDCIRVN